MTILSSVWLLFLFAVTAVAVVWGRGLVVGRKHFQAERLMLNFSEAKPSAYTPRLGSWHTRVPIGTAVTHLERHWVLTMMPG